MARNWLRHHIDAQDGQAVVRKIVVSPAADSAAVLNDTPGDTVNMSAQQARFMVERARQVRENRQRQATFDRRMR